MDDRGPHKTTEALPLLGSFSPQTLIVSAFLVAFSLLTGISIPSLVRPPADISQ